MNTSSIGRVTAQLLRVWRLLTPVEWLTIAIVCGVLAALLSPDSWTVARRKIERRAREWAPSESDRKQPSASLMAPDFDIAGQWAVRRHLNASSNAMHVGALLFVFGWTVTFVGLGVEILAMLAMNRYRLRRALPCSPLGLLGLGGTCFYIGVAVVALGKCLGQ